MFVYLNGQTWWTWAPELTWILQKGLRFSYGAYNHRYSDRDSGDAEGAPWKAKNDAHLRFARSKYLYSDEIPNQAAAFFKKEQKDINNIGGCSGISMIKKIFCEGGHKDVYSEEVFNRAVSYLNTRGECELGNTTQKGDYVNNSLELRNGGMNGGGAKKDEMSDGGKVCRALLALLEH